MMRARAQTTVFLSFFQKKKKKVFFVVVGGEIKKNPTSTISLFLFFFSLSARDLSLRNSF